MTERRVILRVIATENYCNNECSGLQWEAGLVGTAARCYFFDQPLEWNKQRKSNGYKRLNGCKYAEVGKGSSITWEWLERVRADCELREVTGDSYDVSLHSLIKEVRRLVAVEVSLHELLDKARLRWFTLRTRFQVLHKGLIQLGEEAKEGLNADGDDSSQPEG